MVRDKVKHVGLIGSRNRVMPLTRVTETEMNSRLSRTADGSIREDFVLRGTPAIWTQIGTMVYIWPIPTHSWVMAGEC